VAFRTTLALLLVVVVASGCGGAGELDEPAETKTEWLGRFGSWYSELPANPRAGPAVEQAGPDELIRFTDCASSFRSDVGTPPAELARVAALVTSACRSYERAAATRIPAEADPGDALFERERQLQLGDSAMLDAFAELERRLASARPLPRRAGAAGRTDASRIDPRYGRAAGRFSQRAVEVRCWDEDDWERISAEEGALAVEEPDYAGMVGLDSTRIHLSPAVCDSLDDLAYGGGRPGGDDAEDLAFALLALAHENEHLVAPSGTEAETECYGLQRVDDLAQALGAGAAYARELAETAWEELYAENDPEYFSEECRDGGALDADRGSSLWP
jgi:hypothetical protein